VNEDEQLIAVLELPGAVSFGGWLVCGFGVDQPASGNGWIRRPSGILTEIPLKRIEDVKYAAAGNSKCSASPKQETSTSQPKSASLCIVVGDSLT
jgi:hypothetical protein